MYVRVAPNSQVGEILAIRLLNNANFNVQTFSNAKMKLVAMAKERKSTDPRAPSSLTPNAVPQIQEVENKANELL